MDNKYFATLLPRRSPAILLLVPVTFANRMNPAQEGALQPFTDSNTATWGATIAGGGTNHVLGYYDGSNWTVAAI